MKSTLKKYLAFIEMVAIDLVCVIGLYFLSSDIRIWNMFAYIGLLLITIVVFTYCTNNGKGNSKFQKAIYSFGIMLLFVWSLIRVYYFIFN